MVTSEAATDEVLLPTITVCWQWLVGSWCCKWPRQLALFVCGVIVNKRTVCRQVPIGRAAIAIKLVGLTNASYLTGWICTAVVLKEVQYHCAYANNLPPFWWFQGGGEAGPVLCA